MSIEPIPFAGVIVQAERKTPLYTRYRLDNLTIRNSPSLGEPDLFYAMTLLPGVTMGNDLKGDLHFRGGSSDQNLILLDGVELYNPYHLLGLFGTFNVGMIEDARVYVGNFPVRYGDRISSVVDISTLRKTSRKMVNFSLLSSSLVVNSHWKKISFLTAARRTYYDLFIKQLDYHFYDFYGKLTYQLSPHFSVETGAFFSHDHLTPEPLESPEVSDNWGNQMAFARVRYEGAHSIHTLQISRVKNYMDFTPELVIDNTLKDLTAQYDMRTQWRSLQFEAGGSVKQIEFNYAWRDKGNDIQEIFYEEAPDTFDYQRKVSLTSAFGSLSLSLGTARMELGVRYHNWMERNDFSPRLFYSMPLGKTGQLSLRIGRYFQILNFGREGIEGSVSSPLFPSGQPITADAFSLGFQQNVSAVQLEIEGYYKNYHSLKRLSLPFPEMESGNGRVWGVDLFVKKEQGAVTYQLNYGFLHTRAEFGEERYPFDWEFAHRFNGLIGFRIGKGWYINQVINFHSGAPFTPVAGRYFRLREVRDGNTQYQSYFNEFLDGERNSIRLPHYFRMDISLRKKFYKRRMNYTIYIQILNMLNSGNVLRYDWRDYYQRSYDSEGNLKPGSGGQVRALPILPSIGVEFEF
ncbi:MAG: hypothetical protein D6732_03935 [Methanobacteriota archaeon]|nr:MAG: hypothetical protein D6732_03935 [Euryarchaeota archaeon]